MSDKEIDVVHARLLATDMSIKEALKEAYELGKKHRYKKYFFVPSHVNNYHYDIMDRSTYSNRDNYVQIVGRKDIVTKEQAEKIAQYCVDVLNGDV